MSEITPTPASEVNVPPTEGGQTVDIQIQNAANATPIETPSEPPSIPNPSPNPNPKPQAQPSPHSKPCDLCHRSRDVLIRCQIDETKQWHFVCTGKCWKDVSVGNQDGSSDYPFFRYGGMWKNKHELVSAKIKGEAKKRNQELSLGWRQIHRRRGGKTRTIAKRKDGIVIGEDDGADDIEVSDFSDDENIGAALNDDSGPEHIQVKKL
jgi:hypothetical protein